MFSDWFVLVNEALFPYVAEISIHDTDDVSTGSDHNPITVERLLNTQAESEKRKLQAVWTSSAKASTALPNLIDEQLKFFAAIVEHLNYDQFESLIEVVASNTKGIKPKLTKSGVKKVKVVRKTVRSKMLYVRN